MYFALAPALLALFVCGTEDGAGQEEKAETVWEYLVLKYDADKDGRVSKAEYTRGDEHWLRLDKNADGFLDASEFASEGRRGRRRGGRGSGGRGEDRGRAPEAPKAGEQAPDFELVVLPATSMAPTNKQGGNEQQDRGDRKAEFVKLSSFKGVKPVALIFGSYT